MSLREEPENLSEILFKPKFEYTETSLISNSGADMVPVSPRWAQVFDCLKGWYRPLHILGWVMAGGKLSEIDAALASIAVSPEKRSRPDCADTVSAYGRGNWNYEFNAIAQERALLAKEAEAKAQAAAGDEERGRVLYTAAHQYRMAARYFTIASYPRLKGDELASESYMHALRMYRRIFTCAPELGRLQISELKTPEGPITCVTHLPPPDKGAPEPVPFVIVCGSYESSLTDFHAIYRMFFLPRHLGMVVVELPGIGTSEKLSLNYDLSVVVDAALRHAQTCPDLDSTRAALLGVRMGGTACLRSAVLNPGKIKAMGLIEPAVDHMFTDKEFLRSFPLCVRSLYANRLGQNAAQWEQLIPQMQVFSLKKQGLLSLTRSSPVPVMLFTPSEVFTSAADAALISSCFKDFTYYSDPWDRGDYSKRPNLFMYRACSAMLDFICQKLG